MNNEITREDAMRILELILWTRSDFIDIERKALKFAIKTLGEDLDEQESD